MLVAKVLLCFEKYSTKQTVIANLVAHRDRNRITAMMFSLTLAFVIFLSIVARIPFIVDYLNVTRAKGFHSMRLGRMNLPMVEMEKFIKQREHYFEEFGAVTPPLYNMNDDIFWEERHNWSYRKGIDEVQITDVNRKSSNRISLLGASPGFIDSIEPDFSRPVYYDREYTRFDQNAWLSQLYDQGGLTFGEQLYSAKGSQSGILPEHFRRKFDLQLSNNPN